MSKCPKSHGWNGRVWTRNCIFCPSVCLLGFPRGWSRRGSQRKTATKADWLGASCESAHGKIESVTLGKIMMWSQGPGSDRQIGEGRNLSSDTDFFLLFLLFLLIHPPPQSLTRSVLCPQASGLRAHPPIQICWCVFLLDLLFPTQEISTTTLPWISLLQPYWLCHVPGPYPKSLPPQSLGIPWPYCPDCSLSPSLALVLVPMWPYCKALSCAQVVILPPIPLPWRIFHYLAHHITFSSWFLFLSSHQNVNFWEQGNNVCFIQTVHDT